VFPVECERRLAKRALQLTGVEVRIGDGHDGWPDRAPFDCVIATAAVAEVPAVWLAQLAPAGRIVCPLGRTYQRLTVTTLVDEPRADLSVDFETLSRM
jgi:protein-L-isoaspartate(D-aspartate) O-methyltransferase